MARHKEDLETQDQLAELADTQAKLGVAVEALTEVGVTQKAMAAAAGVSESYISQIINGSTGKRPRSSKVVAVVKALDAMVDANHLKLGSTARPAADALSEVAKRYGITISPLADPAGPMLGDARNYVMREGFDGLLEENADRPGVYVLDGPPMSGISSAAARLDVLGRQMGRDVDSINATSDLQMSGQLEASTTGVLGALVAVLTQEEAALTERFLDVQVRFERFLDSSQQGRTIILDEVNALAAEEINDLKTLVRDWQTKRARRMPEYDKLSLWIATSSRVGRVVEFSSFRAATLLSSWFESDEVYELSRTLAEARINAPVPAVRALADEAAARALSSFGGQPQMTHLYLWSMLGSKGGSKADRLPAVADELPKGLQRQLGLHLDKVASHILRILGSGQALELASDPPGAAAEFDEPLSRLQVVDPTARTGFSCAYYAERLPDLLRKAVAKEAVG